MKRLKISLLSIAALAVLVGPGMIKNATAGVRVKATVRTPNVSVRIGNTPSRHYRSFVRKPLPVRHVRHHVIITQQDRKIARRLARYTGVQARELIFLRARGFTWVTIGRWLELRPRAIRAAMRQDSWNRFLRHDCQMACCDDGRRRPHQVVYVDEYVGDNDAYEDYDD